MEEMFENTILDELYEIREGKVENSYLEKYGESKVEKRANEAENELVEFMKKFIKEEKNMQEFFDKVTNYELTTMSAICFWYKAYYKIGFIDGISLKREIKEERIENINSNDSIFNQNLNEITDYFEEKKYKSLKVNSEYQKIATEIERIKTKFPKIRYFIEDDEITEFTQEESKALLKVIRLNDDRATYEENEMFKIGLKEGKLL